MTLLMIGVIRLYQLTISQFLGPCCRFDPNCSAYALQALNEYGLFKGCYLALRRLMRCHPWHGGGVDPLP